MSLLVRDEALEIVDRWVENALALAGTRVLELTSRALLRDEAAQLVEAMTDAFSAESFEDLTQPMLAPLVDRLRKLGVARVEQGFSPSETAVFVFSFKDALLPVLQSEYGDTPERLVAEVVRLNQLIDRLALVTFETFAETREQLVLRQARALEFSTPVLRIWEELALMPLVGVIDTARAAQILEHLLPAVVAFEARVVILDLTGVPMIDTRVAQHLMKTVTATRMLGAEVIVTGLSPETAQTLTKLAIDVSSLKTRGSLRAGLTEAFALIGRRVVASG